MSNRIGMDQSIGVIVTLVIGLAIVLSLFFMAHGSLTEFFENVDTSSDDTIDNLDCKAKCFSCCIKNPSRTNPGECDDSDIQLACKCVC